METSSMMDFTFDETQSSLRDLARQIFEAHATHDRLKELEAGGESFDPDLWLTLERSGLLSIGVEDGGFLEQCVVLVEQGRTVAPVPLWSHLVGNAVAKRDGIVTVAIEGEGIGALDVADAVVVTSGDEVFVAERGAVVASRREITTGYPEWELDGFEGSRIEADARDLRNRATVALCAIGVGVAERALELTASYTSQRHQFGKPLGSFQAVQQRAADAYIDVEAMRTTMWQAAWRISEGLEADHAVAVAKFWAAEGGQRVVSAAQHLHGGMGADVDYPLHRYTLWSKWVELSFGGATETLARMGKELAR
jgi:alkylation response protein AidB-like acyl-CoA dehydrogenase